MLLASTRMIESSDRQSVPAEVGSKRILFLWRVRCISCALDKTVFMIIKMLPVKIFPRIPRLNHIKWWNEDTVPALMRKDVMTDSHCLQQEMSILNWTVHARLKEEHKGHEEYTKCTTSSSIWSHVPLPWKWSLLPSNKQFFFLPEVVNLYIIELAALLPFTCTTF